jgi:hypothetical protein
MRSFLKGVLDTESAESPDSPTTAKATEAKRTGRKLQEPEQHGYVRASRVPCNQNTWVWGQGEGHIHLLPFLPAFSACPARGFDGMGSVLMQHLAPTVLGIHRWHAALTFLNDSDIIFSFLFMFALSHT